MEITTTEARSRRRERRRWLSAGFLTVLGAVVTWVALFQSVRPPWIVWTEVGEGVIIAGIGVAILGLPPRRVPRLSYLAMFAVGCGLVGWGGWLAR